MRWGLAFIFLASTCVANAWNALGHQLVAQVAYDNLTPRAKKMCQKYNRAYNKVYPSAHFIAASTWLDVIKTKNMHQYDTLHYIDIPFSTDNTRLPAIPENNALTAMHTAITILSSNTTSDSAKGLQLRILVHVVGDIHQPLHTVTRVSQKLPNGDAGGNLVRVRRSAVGRNLHQYWDRGGGILMGPRKKFHLKQKARQLEKQWPCTALQTDNHLEQWVRDAHLLALQYAYSLVPNQAPSTQYQDKVQQISKQQIALAGCRLATLLNTLAENSVRVTPHVIPSAARD